MIVLNTKSGNLKITNTLLTLILSSSLTLTGCINQKEKKEIEVKKASYTVEQLEKMSGERKYSIKNQSNNSKLVVHIYDNQSNNNVAKFNQIEGVKLKIMDSKGNIVDIFTTKKDKEYVLKNLNPDKYTLEIINVPEEYKIPNNLYQFTIEDKLIIGENYLYTINYIDIVLEKLEKEQTQENNKKLSKTYSKKYTYKI